MFFVLSKEKIYAYVVSIATVIMLLGMAYFIKPSDTIEASSNNSNLLPIYSVETEENKVAFTMNCAW